jgi:glycosyltransferase involved in cell wall biosynthesis
MKIALWNNLPSGGGKRAFHAMAAGLLSRGHQLESWCPPSARVDFEPLADLMSETVVEYTQLVRRRALRLLPGRSGYGRQYAAMEKHTEECARQINARDFDVCLIGNCQQFAVPPIGRFLRTPAVHYCQELLRSNQEAMFGPESVKNPGIKALCGRVVSEYWRSWERGCERVDLSTFEAVAVNSYYSRESLLRAHGTESQVCYLGIDLQRFGYSDKPRDRTVIGLGALQPHKDPATAIEALATIPKSRRPKLVWIGNVAQKGYVAELVRLASKLEVQLTLRESISDQELVRELNLASVMIYTSRLEPFGFAPLEGNACGLPVVAIAEGGVRETVRDGFNGLLVSDRSPVKLGSAVENLLANPTLARQMSVNGREWIGRDWTWSKCAQRLEEILAEVAR